MTRLQLQLGPVSIDILATRLPQDVEADNYVPFASSGVTRPRLTLRTRIDPPPERGHASLLAQLATHWAVYRRRTGYRLEIFEQVHFRPRQIVLLNRALDQADVYLLPCTSSGFMASRANGDGRSRSARRAGPTRVKSTPAARGPSRQFGDRTREGGHEAAPTSIADDASNAWHLALVMNPLIQWWLTAYLASRRKGLILHASAVSINGVGLAFVGPSGGGKTTVARWCRDQTGAVILNDDRIVIWRGANGFCVSGTPWHGELPDVAALTVPLAGLFILAKGETNRFTAWLPARTVSRMVPETFLPIWNPEAMAGLLETGERLAREVPSGELHFKNDSSIADYLAQFADTYPAVPLGRSQH